MAVIRCSIHLSGGISINFNDKPIGTSCTYFLFNTSARGSSVASWIIFHNKCSFTRILQHKNVKASCAKTVRDVENPRLLHLEVEVPIKPAYIFKKVFTTLNFAAPCYSSLPLPSPRTRSITSPQNIISRCLPFAIFYCGASSRI